jgi:hypothetical protein
MKFKNAASTTTTTKIKTTMDKELKTKMYRFIMHWKVFIQHHLTKYLNKIHVHIIIF